LCFNEDKQYKYQWLVVAVKRLTCRTIDMYHHIFKKPRHDVGAFVILKIRFVGTRTGAQEKITELE